MRQRTYGVALKFSDPVGKEKQKTARKALPGKRTSGIPFKSNDDTNGDDGSNAASGVHTGMVSRGTSEADAAEVSQRVQQPCEASPEATPQTVPTLISDTTKDVANASVVVQVPHGESPAAVLQTKLARLAL
jgi:hypothetical protein